MPTTCVAKFHCGAYGPGWLNGDHPMPLDGRVKRIVCFHLEGECCKEKISIQLRNCGKFMVYFLPPTPRCPLKYCGSKVEDGKFGRFFTRSFAWKTCVQIFYWGIRRGVVKTSGLPSCDQGVDRERRRGSFLSEPSPPSLPQLARACLWFPNGDLSRHSQILRSYVNDY